MSGAHEIISAIAETGMPLGLATGSSGNIFQIKQAAHQELFSRFHAIVVGDDPAVANGKPAPDPYLEAAKRIGVFHDDLSKVLVIEDSPNGVQSGLAAGMLVAWIPDPVLDAHPAYPELIGHSRVRLFSSLHDLKEVLFK